MKLEHKLDALQNLARKYAGDPRKVYLVTLLADHAGDQECSENFLGWVDGALLKSQRY